jgi:heme/copper-type cytochrome/quinol oxidase subunit 3
VTEYTLEARADTGVSNSTLGLWLFLASEVMLFGALFSAYALLRVSAAAWPSGRDVLNVVLGTVNTAVLMAATFNAWRARSLALPRARRALQVATFLAAVFVVNKAIEYRSEFAHGMVPAVSTFLAMYYTLTGFHALHVIGGILANGWALAGRAGEAMTLNRIRLLAWYWAFVDAIWLVIFLLVYVS